MNQKIKSVIIEKYDEKFVTPHILPALKSKIEFLPSSTKNTDGFPKNKIWGYMLYLLLVSVTAVAFYRGISLFAKASPEMNDLRIYELELGAIYMLFGCASLVILCVLVARNIKRS